MIALSRRRPCRFRVWRLVYQNGQWSWFGPCNCYTYCGGGTIVKYARPNL